MYVCMSIDSIINEFIITLPVMCIYKHRGVVMVTANKQTSLVFSLSLVLPV